MQENIFPLCEDCNRDMGDSAKGYEWIVARNREARRSLAQSKVSDSRDVTKFPSWKRAHNAWDRCYTSVYMLDQ